MQTVRAGKFKMKIKIATGPFILHTSNFIALCGCLLDYGILQVLRRTMAIWRSALKWQLALVYLDDIVVFSRGTARHIDHSEHVLAFSRDAGSP